MTLVIRKVVEHIRKDVCKDCENRCGLCEKGVCQDVITEIGCFFLYIADKEGEMEK